MEDYETSPSRLHMVDYLFDNSGISCLTESSAACSNFGKRKQNFGINRPGNCKGHIQTPNFGGQRS